MGLNVKQFRTGKKKDKIEQQSQKDRQNKTIE
jgi:hypothetical protein